MAPSSSNYNLDLHYTIVIAIAQWEQTFIVSFFGRRRKEEEERERERKRREKLEIRDHRRAEREEKRKRRREEEKRIEEERQMQIKIALEERKILIARRKLETIRLLSELFNRIKVTIALEKEVGMSTHKGSFTMHNFSKREASDFFLARMGTGIFNSTIQIEQFSSDCPQKIARKNGCCTHLRKPLTSEKSLSL